MTKSPFLFLRNDNGCLYLQGEWVLANYHALLREIQDFSQQQPTYQVLDFSALDKIDTAGAEQLCYLLTAEKLAQRLDQAQGLSTERNALLRTVAQAISNEGPPQPKVQQNAVGYFF